MAGSLGARWILRCANPRLCEEEDLDAVCTRATWPMDIQWHAFVRYQPRNESPMIVRDQLLFEGHLRQGKLGIGRNGRFEVDSRSDAAICHHVK